MKNFPIKVNTMTHVTQIPYRQARIVNAFLLLDRRDENVRKFEEMLAGKSGHGVDNHTTYVLTRDVSREELYVFCSDEWVHIGTQIIKGSW